MIVVDKSTSQDNEFGIQVLLELYITVVLDKMLYIYTNIGWNS